MSVVTVEAGAKVTLALRVLGTRDDGYHILDALAVTVDAPVDVLTITPGGSGCIVEPDGAAPTDARNLAVRALALLGVDAGLHLHKRIPSEAGLGGGSADAAAVLRSLGSDRAPTELLRLGATLGADVPVCLAGGAARMAGVGDVVTPVEVPGPLHLLLVTPSFGCSTPAVYRAWDDLGGPTSDRVLDTPRGWRSLLPDGIVNDLEPAAEAVEPRLRPFREELERRVGLPAFLCGSGSSLAVVCPSHDHATALGATVRLAHPDCRLVAAASVPW